MSAQAWLGWLAWGVVVFFILLWHQGRREAREHEQAPRTSRPRRPSRGTPAGDREPAGPGETGLPPPSAPEPSFEGWVDAYQPRTTETAPTPPWARATASATPQAAGGGTSRDASLAAHNRAAIVDAIARRASIRFRYTNRQGEPSHRTVRPAAITTLSVRGRRSRSECVVGFCQMRQEERCFNLARIRDLQVLDT